jgi:hypothetical protein
MTEIKLTKRYPNSRTEDITDAYMRGWNDALDAVQNGKFHIADTPQTMPKDNGSTIPYDQYPHLVKTSSISRDSHEVADTPQTETKNRNSNSTFKFERTIEIDGDVVRYGEWEFTGQPERSE